MLVQCLILHYVQQKSYLEVFESKNVENVNTLGLSFEDDSVHTTHEPSEEGTVQDFGNGVPRVEALVNG